MEESDTKRDLRIHFYLEGGSKRTFDRRKETISYQMDWNRFFNRKTPNTPPPHTAPQKPSPVPMFNQALSATRGFTDAFSAITAMFKKFGPMNIQAGIGYGIGFSHGFGLGLSLRSGVWDQMQSGLVVAATNMMMKFGRFPRLPFSKGALVAPSKSAQSKVTTDQISAGSIMQLATKPADHISAGSIMQLATKSASQLSQGLVGSPPTKIELAFENKALKGTAVDSASDSQTQKVISNLPQNPLLKGEGGRLDEAAGGMQPENNIIQTVLKQRQLMEELVEENEKLHQILQVKDLKTPSSKVQASSSEIVEENEKLHQILQVKDLKTPSSKVQASSSDSNLQTSPPSEVQDKVTTDSRPPGDADVTSPTPKRENDSEKEKS